jgi:hypothetical protein
VADLLDGVDILLTFHDGNLFKWGRVADVYPQQEPVQLRLREGESALVFDRVLRGQDVERRRHLAGDTFDGDLALLHGLQQGGLYFGRGPVDFVGQYHLCGERAGPELEIGDFLIVYRDAGDIAGEHIGGKLNPLEGAVDRFRQAPRQHGLADAGGVLDEQVPLADEGDYRQLHRLCLADHDLFDVLHYFFRQRLGFLDNDFRFFHFSPLFNRMTANTLYFEYNTRKKSKQKYQNKDKNTTTNNQTRSLHRA